MVASCRLADAARPFCMVIFCRILVKCAPCYYMMLHMGSVLCRQPQRYWDKRSEDKMVQLPRHKADVPPWVRTCYGSASASKRKVGQTLC